jgi:ubiquinone/menaquinone biosynthesis C-methylase UbiE
VNYLPDILNCPHCTQPLQTAPDGCLCNSCSTTFSFRDGYINLLADPGLGTQLDEQTYDAAHGITDVGKQKMWQTWCDLFDRHQVQSGRVLELGAGSGQLTDGLIRSRRFAENHVSDISAHFLKIIDNNLKDTPNPPYYYLCDANQLPFQPDTMDCVIGNSVLHHFLTYERTLQSVLKVLKPGGKAFFFEPVMQGKILVAMMLHQLVNVDRRTAGLYQSEEHTRMLAIARHITGQPVQSAANLEDLLAKREDKYIFDLDSLSELAERIGYRALHAEQPPNLDRSFFNYLAHQLSMLGLAGPRLQQYRWLFDAIESSLGTQNLASFTAPMLYLVLEK